MEILGSVLTVLNIVDKSKGLYDWFTGVSKGDQLKQVLRELEQSKSQIQRLSDRVLWAPTFLEATPTAQKPVILSATDTQVVQGIEAGIHATDGDVLISAVSRTPERLRIAFDKNPFEVLFDARPERFVTHPPQSDMVPIRFVQQGEPYIGWQKRGALPALLDCAFEAVQRSAAAPAPNSKVHALSNRVPIRWEEEVGYMPTSVVRGIWSLANFVIAKQDPVQKARLVFSGDRISLTLSPAQQVFDINSQQFSRWFVSSLDDESNLLTGFATSPTGLAESEGGVLACVVFFRRDGADAALALRQRQERFTAWITQHIGAEWLARRY